MTASERAAKVVDSWSYEGSSLPVGAELVSRIAAAITAAVAAEREACRKIAEDCKGHGSGGSWITYEDGRRAGRWDAANQIAAAIAARGTEGRGEPNERNGTGPAVDAVGKVS